MGNGGDPDLSKKTILRVIVENLVYPVTIEVLQQVSSSTSLNHGLLGYKMAAFKFCLQCFKNVKFGL